MSKNLDFEALVALDAIVKEGSFAAAAEKMNKVRSALTHTIQKLEYQVGFEIFDRSGHRARLTSRGEYLYTQSQPLFSQMKNLKEKVSLKQNLWESVFHIALEEAIPMQNLTPLIRLFQEHAPHVNLSISYERLNGLWDCLATKRAHLAIGVTGDPPSDLSYGIEPLGQMEMKFVCSPKHPLATMAARGAEITTKDIECHAGAIVTDTAKELPKRTSGVYQGQNHVIVNSMAAKRQLILDGVAVGYLHTTLIQDDLRANRLLSLRVKALKRKATYSYAWDGDHVGKALAWWLDRLMSPTVRTKILMPTFTIDPPRNEIV